MEASFPAALDSRQRSVLFSLVTEIDCARRRSSLCQIHAANRSAQAVRVWPPTQCAVCASDATSQRQSALPPPGPDRQRSTRMPIWTQLAPACSFAWLEARLGGLAWQARSIASWRPSW
eukprot:3183804-Pleurochrysis_carterae.AAC.1